MDRARGGHEPIGARLKCIPGTLGVILIAAGALLPAAASGETSGCERIGGDRVRVEMSRVASLGEAPERVARALRREAMGRAAECGGETVVRSIEMSVQAEASNQALTDFFSSVVDVLKRAVLKDVSWSKDKLEIVEGDAIRVTVTLTARVLQPPGQVDPSYRLRLDVMRSEDAEFSSSPAGVRNLRDGESFWLAARPTQDSWIALFDIDDAGRAYQLFPVSFQPEARVEGTQILEFPDETQRRQGVVLRATSDDEQDAALHRFLAIALRSKPAWGRTVEPNYWAGLSEDKMPLLEAVLEPLASEDLSRWTLDVVVFRVYSQ
jgi:hypothetical protein